MRVDQRDDHEERLLGRGRGGDELERTLLAGTLVAHRRHEAPVVVGDAPAHLGEALIGAGVVGVPAREAVLRQIRGAPGGARRLAAVPLALVDDVVAGGGHHRRDVRQGARRGQGDLRVRRWLHVRLEGVLDPVLIGEVPRHERRAGGRAHARIGERVVEGDAVPLELRQPRKVLLRPAEREVLDRPLLVGDEHDHVHPREARGRPRPRGGARRAGRESPEPERARGQRGSFEEPAPGDALAGPLGKRPVFVHGGYVSPRRRKRRTSSVMGCPGGPGGSRGVVASPLLVEIRENAGVNAPEFLYLDEPESGGA